MDNVALGGEMVPAVWRMQCGVQLACGASAVLCYGMLLRREHTMSW